MTKGKSPHTAILHIKIDVYDVLPTGECSGNTVPSSILKDYKLKPFMLLAIDGYDMDDCLKKLRRKIEDFHNG